MFHSGETALLSLHNRVAMVLPDAAPFLTGLVGGAGGRKHLSLWRAELWVG